MTSSPPSASLQVLVRSVALRVVLLVVMALAAFALVEVALAKEPGLRISVLGLRVSDPLRPLLWAMIAGSGLLLLEWGNVRKRRLIVAALALLGALAVVAFGRTAAPIITDGDFALGELFTDLAARGQLLLGPYSRFGWHHPGPLFFYLSAPFYKLSGNGTPSLYAISLLTNVVAIVGMAWAVAHDSQRWVLAAALTMGCLLFASRLPMFLASPWTAHVPVLISLTFLVLAAAVASGSTGLLPCLTAVASLVTQTHVGFVPVVVLIFGGTLVALALNPSIDRRTLRTAINRSAWVFALLWLLPATEAIAHGGGNVAALAQFFVFDTAPVHSMGEAFREWSYGLTSVLRPDFELPWGGHFEMSGLGWAMPFAVAEMLILAAVIRIEAKAGHRFEAALAVVAVATSLISLWSLTRIRGDVLNHDLFRIAAVGAFNLSIIAGVAVRSLLAALRPDWLTRPALKTIAFVLLAVAGVTLAGRDLEAMTSYERRRTEREMTVRAYAAIRDYLAQQHVRHPLFRIDDDQWANAAAIILRLRHDGVPVSVTDASLPMFTDTFAANGTEDTVITLANIRLHRELSERPGNVVLFDSNRVFVDVMPVTPLGRR